LHKQLKRKPLIASILSHENTIVKKDDKKGTLYFLKEKLKSPVNNYRIKGISSFFADSHQKQMHLLNSDLDAELTISDEERDINQKSKFFLASAGVSALASFAMSASMGFLSLPAILYILQNVYKESYKSLVYEKKLSVHVLVAILISLLVVKGLFLASNFYLALYLLNRKLMLKLKHNSSNNIVDVFKQRPRSVWVLLDGVETEIPFEQLNMADIVVINPGETIPIDGTVVSGIASVDQHLLTGESQPIEKGPGDQVFALTMLLSGRLEVEVNKAGDETVAAHIGDVLNQTVDVKTGMQLWSERMTDITVLPIFLLTGLMWPVLGGVESLIILNSHFRYRLTIITSTGMLNFLNIAAQKGILIKDGRTIELLNKIDTVVFDKTGTLTEEQPHIGQIHSCLGYTDEQILRFAATAEYKQTHPIARAILMAADNCNMHLPIEEIDHAEVRIGYGVLVAIAKETVRVGSLRFMEMEGCVFDPAMRETQAYCKAQGHSLVFVALEGCVIGAIELHATVRPEAESVINQLRQRGVNTMYIISGDQEQPTQKLAEQLGIDHYFAEILPERKADLIAQLQSEGKSVCYIGDGINDSIALKKADVSVSLRGASSVAIDTAQVILMDGSLHQLDELFELANGLRQNMRWTVTSVLAPCAASLVGAFIPGFTIIDSLILSGVSVVAGFGCAISPLMYYQREPTQLRAQNHLTSAEL
ncbi:MAG: heavy metal translocating P-type ATPase, partial [Chloroflexota bacterium]